jgi:predicted GNAT family acetyltransferase
LRKRSNERSYEIYLNRAPKSGREVCNTREYENPVGLYLNGYTCSALLPGEDLLMTPPESTPPPPTVTHDTTHQRFIIETGEEQVPQLTYELTGDAIHMTSVRVPAKHRQKGYASEITKTALEYAKHEQLRVVPICPFVRWYLDHNPEYKTLLAHPTM